MVHCSPRFSKHVFWRWPDGFRLDFLKHVFLLRSGVDLVLYHLHPFGPCIFLKGTRMTRKSCSLTRVLLSQKPSLAGRPALAIDILASFGKILLLVDLVSKMLQIDLFEIFPISRPLLKR